VNYHLGGGPGPGGRRGDLVACAMLPSRFDPPPLLLSKPAHKVKLKEVRSFSGRIGRKVRTRLPGRGQSRTRSHVRPRFPAHALSTSGINPAAPRLYSVLPLCPCSVLKAGAGTFTSPHLLAGESKPRAQTNKINQRTRRLSFVTERK
jgi:hypothetical protein